MSRDELLIHDEMSERIVETAADLAMNEGIEEVTVSRIIRTLGVTNRVFYNRFHNVEEVLGIVYQDLAVRMRQSILNRFDPEGDFFQQMEDIAAGTLTLSYKLKIGLSQYIFAKDSLSEENYRWWQEQIREFIQLGKNRGLVKPDLDPDAVSYAIWCFIRGYNADALTRELPEEEAVESFRYSFRLFLNGMKS